MLGRPSKSAPATTTPIAKIMMMINMGDMRSACYKSRAPAVSVSHSVSLLSPPYHAALQLRTCESQASSVDLLISCCAARCTRVLPTRGKLCQQQYSNELKITSVIRACDEQNINSPRTVHPVQKTALQIYLHRTCHHSEQHCSHEEPDGPRPDTTTNRPSPASGTSG